uniref:Putative udp-glucuronosyl and udp-glucosyl transferase n=1 Tax=Lutzomyia longipalpis TaxID=7200 RepID=A0A7G3B3G6_LUTLO
MFSKTIFILLLYLIHTLNYGLCERILAIFPVPSKSNSIIGETLVRELKSHGHQITYVTPYRMREGSEAVQEIFIDGTVAFARNEEYLKELHQPHSVLETITQSIFGSAELVNFTLSHKEVQKLLRSDASYDLLIVDSFMMDALLGFANHYKVPSVVVCTTASNKWTDELVGNPYNPAYSPNLFLGSPNKMTFTERIVNALLSLFVEISYQYLYLPAQEALYQRFFAPLQPKDGKLPALEDLIHNVSSVFVNSHPGFHYPRALMPNIVEIGGIHIREPKKLPADVDRLYTLATGGVIVLTLGSTTRSKDMQKEKRDAFNRVFKEMPDVGIFWKWEDAQMPGQVDNVIIGPWLPQFDLLMFGNNTKLLITDGGISSIYEAIFSGTPVLGIPMHGDQHFNMRLAEEAGFGRTLRYDTLTEDIIREAVVDMLKNETYRRNAERVSRQMQDNPLSVKEKAMHSIEMILRTGGARHLRSPSLDLSIWQLYLVDVTLCIVAGCVLILAIPAAIIGIVLRRSNRPSQSVINGDTKRTEKSSRSDNSKKEK